MRVLGGKHMRKHIIAAALAIALAPLAAWAEQDVQPLQIRALVGYRGFAQKAARDLMKGGPAYGVALDVGLGPWAAVEGNWLGSSFGEKGALAIGKQRVMQNDVSAILKVGPRYGMAEPYAFGGAGYSWIRDTSHDPLLRDTSYFILPAGVGIDWQLTPNATLGARGQYEFGFGKDVYSPIAPARASRTDQYAVVASLGAKF